MSEYFLSVVIPSYNHIRFVETAIASVIEQSLTNIEIVVIDDGSLDGTPLRSEELLGRQERFKWRVIRQSNQGAHAAINHGISLARGEWIAILNSDDRFTPTRISKMLDHAEKTGSRFVISRVAHIDENGHPLAETTPHRHYYNWSVGNRELYPTPNFELLRHNYAITTGNFFFHRSVFEKIGPFRDFKICHDWDFLLRALRVTEISFLDEILYEYRVHSNNTINPSVQDLRYGEMDSLLSDYIRQAENSENPLAPSFKNWGSYWLKFIQSEIPFGYLPRTAQAIQEAQNLSIQAVHTGVDFVHQEMISAALLRSQKRALQLQEELSNTRKYFEGQLYKSLPAIIWERIKAWAKRFLALA
ncbi:MAG TPA: glycosyltransferase [Anaerolineales bacterium]|nr:glycosyltransferase [Anaerolineales bacterium]